MTSLEVTNAAEPVGEHSPIDTDTLKLKVEKSNSATENSISKTPIVQPESKPKEKVCGVCSDHEARYKCSRCQLPYCSVACATLHRATHPAVDYDAPPKTVEVGLSFDSDTKVLNHIPDTITATGYRNPFTTLEEAKELQTLFMIYPRLRSQLRDIYTATLPRVDDLMGTAGQVEDQIYPYKGKGRGKGRNGRGKERASWNTDRSTQDGIDALCSAKEQYGKGGEGIREYADLVLKLVSVEGVDVARLVEEEVAEENAQIIAQLLNGDSL